MRDPRRLVGVGLVAVFLLVLIEGLRFPSEAGFFPKIVGAAGLVLALTLLITRDPVSIHDDVMPSAASPRHRAIALLSAPCFAAMVWLFGFYPAAFLTLLGLPYLLGFRRPWILLAIAITGVILLDLVFSLAMDVALPNGLLGDWILTTFVYDR